jgi:hypothetical protein
VKDAVSGLKMHLPVAEVIMPEPTPPPMARVITPRPK